VKNHQRRPEALTTASAALVVELRSAIQEAVVSEDAGRMAELLSVNDEMLELMKRMTSLSSDAACGTDGGGGERERQRLVLQGLGLSFAGSSTTARDSEDKEHEQSVDDVSPKPDTVVAPDPPDPALTDDLTGKWVEGHDRGSSTPSRVDKGKGRAEPADEKHEIVTRRSYAIHSDSDEDGDDERRMTISPTER